MQSTNDSVTIDVRPFIWPITSIIITLMISVTVIITANILVGGSNNTGAVRGAAVVRDTDNTGGVAAVDTATGVVTVSIDDDAVLGNIDSATVAIVEFSDYECPFCQNFWRDTLGQIKSSYVETGQVVFVYRDLPLSFHEPKASLAANVTECARDQGGDQAFFAMHDAWFENTPSNGAGLTDDQIIQFADQAGLNGRDLLDCANAGTYADEIKADSAAASAVGINGTPGFVIGTFDKSTGEVSGEIVNGAYPFSEFETVIGKYL